MLLLRYKMIDAIDAAALMPRRAIFSPPPRHADASS